MNEKTVNVISGLLTVLVIGIIAIVVSVSNNKSGISTSSSESIEQQTTANTSKAEATVTVPSEVQEEEEIPLKTTTAATTTTTTTTTMTTTTAPPEPIKSFEVIADPCTWSEAKKRCEANGGHLAYITSNSDYKAIKKVAEESGLSFLWIGGTTSVDGNGTVTATWLDGSDFSYVDDKDLWFDGEPSGKDYNSEKQPLEPYVMLWKINGEWSLNDNSDAVLDYYKHANIGYICEYDE